VVALFTYNCTPSDIKRCDSFSRQMTEAMKEWQRRFPVNPEKMHRDTVLSKLGEIGAAHYLRSLGFWAAEPDFEIYGKKEKSYAADILLPGSTGIHVKTQDVAQARRYGTSWVFMKRDPATYEKSHDVVLFCTYKHNRGKPTVQVMAATACNDLQEKELFKPTVRQNNKIKCAVYGEDIIDIPNVDIVSLVNEHRMRA
jgi:hypothetical protein